LNADQRPSAFGGNDEGLETQNFEIRYSAVHKNIIGLRGLTRIFIFAAQRQTSVSSVKSDDKKSPVGTKPL
jgi:hypothetical protein